MSNRSKILLILILLLAGTLRLWNLGSFPAGFNADEASVGYNAYSLLQTGKDEYGTSFPLVFKSFGDFKPGLYFYFVMPFIKILGLSEMAVRLPSALFGIATIFLVYLLGKKIFESEAVGLLSGLLLAISPWHLQFSRGGWESNVATFFITLGVYLFIQGLEKGKYLLWGLLAFLISMYLYQSPRLVVPALFIGLAIFYRGKIWKILKDNFKYTLLLLALSVPLTFQFVGGGGSARFSGLSFLSDPGPASRINELRGEHPNMSSKEAQVLHNKITAYAPAFLGHYLDHFKPDFLFINGDEVIRNKVPETGQFYLVESIFLIFGIIFLVKSSHAYTRILGLWILTAPLASALTFQTPSALRSFTLVVPLTIVMAFGLWKMVNLVKERWRFLIIPIISLFLLFEFAHYLESYYVHYPQRYPLAWEYGFAEMTSKLLQYQDQYEKIVITDRYDQPYILVLFYAKYDPSKYQPQAKLSLRDKFNFGTVRSFDKYEFRSIDPGEVKKSSGVLFIGTEKEIPQGARVIDKVYFPSGAPAFVFAKT